MTKENVTVAFPLGLKLKSQQQTINKRKKKEMKNFTKEQTEKFIQLRAEGNSLNFIAKELCITRQTLARFDIEYQREVAEIQFSIYEELLEKSKLLKTDRIKNFISELARVNQTLEKKEFGILSVMELFKLRELLETKLLAETKNIQIDSGLTENLDFPPVSIEKPKMIDLL